MRKACLCRQTFPVLCFVVEELLRLDRINVVDHLGQRETGGTCVL